MKIRTFLLLTILCSALQGYAQTPVELHITHKLGGIVPFNYNQITYNDLGNPFSLSRVEYYISKISITHDGGMTTNIPDHYTLVNADQDVIDQLGTYNINNVESITFHIGVDTPNNNADPNGHPNGHPLALQSSTMHWGWTAGYRFAALEGYCGPTVDQTMGIHALGNDNYFSQTITISATVNNGKIIIPINGDYTQAFRGIDISSSIITHSEFDEAITLLQNFRDHVFTAGNPVSISNISSKTHVVSIFPIPSNGVINIAYKGTAEIIIYNIQGSEIQRLNKNSLDATQVTISSPGTYFIKIATKSDGIITRTVQVL